MSSNSEEEEDPRSEIYLALLYEKNKCGVALFDAVSTELQIGEFWAFPDDITAILQRCALA